MAQSFLFLLEHIRKYVRKGSGIPRIGSEKAKTKYKDLFISDLKTRQLVLEEWNDNV